MRNDRSLKRRTNLRDPKRKFVLFTEGKNTEPDYFRALCKHLPGTLIDVEIIGEAGVPLTIAEKAAERAAARSRRRSGRSSFEDGDQIWAIFDRDEHPRIEEALDRCKRSRVEVGFSNPCFELWLILHHADFDRPDDRHQVQSHLKTLLCDYDSKKRKTTRCEKLMPFVEAAERRAERQLARRREEGNPSSAPSTTVYRLTRNMREADKNFRRR